jgi:hypothetical protein
VSTFFFWISSALLWFFWIALLWIEIRINDLA